MSGQALTGGCPVVFVSYSREDETWRRRFAEYAQAAGAGAAA